jgi:hypothetical protein
MPISPLDKQRVQYINTLMDGLHDQTSNLYEALIDREYPEVELAADVLIANLTYIKESIKDEV